MEIKRNRWVNWRRVRLLTRLHLILFARVKLNSLSSLFLRCNEFWVDCWNSYSCVTKLSSRGIVKLSHKQIFRLVIFGNLWTGRRSCWIHFKTLWLFYCRQIEILSHWFLFSFLRDNKHEVCEWRQLISFNKFFPQSLPVSLTPRDVFLMWPNYASLEN